MSYFPDRIIYRGRFAPSPTGALHIGSLLCAVASYLDARSQGGVWLVRIDDIDPPRELPGATDAILRSLEIHGLQWDESVLLQSTRLPAYQEVLDQLARKQALYPCTCSRKQSRTELKLYSGHCRNDSFPCHQPHAVRVRLNSPGIVFEDRVQGHCEFLPDLDIDDFVVRRRDGYFSYQLAAMVDDLYQNISHVVRGVDLLDSSARQLYLMLLLDEQGPQYAHIPVLVNAQQQKLSKQNLASALDDQKAVANLLYCLRKLEQPVPADVAPAQVTELLQWAAKNWRPERIPATLSIAL
ncbi:MAG: tRNA glutamyl-Q(34) synthetase GluQRS [Pseudomonadales bacterium]|nr:tRNA glutamyl-Q(34) synthetase GluQRS [Pseudomonadales bacterium]